MSGRRGRVDGTRELPVPPGPYIVVYRLVNQAVEVISLEHGAREWPDQFRV